MTEPRKATRAVTFVRAAHALREAHPEWRWGQAIFNYAAGYQPDTFFREWVDAHRGTSLDPYHDDARIGKFLDAAIREGYLDPGPPEPVECPECQGKMVFPCMFCDVSTMRNCVYCDEHPNYCGECKGAGTVPVLRTGEELST